MAESSMIRHESGQTGARSGWFVALSGKSALSRDSLGPLGRNMHADDLGVSRVESWWSRGGGGAIRSTIGDIGAHSCLVRAHSGQCNGGFTH